MNDRVSKTVVLCEDDPQARLVREYMKRCGVPHRPPFVQELVASRMRRGGNIGWVLDRFPQELHACRQRSKKVKTLLVVCVDADDRSTNERRGQLFSRVEAEGYDKCEVADPVVFLIPKRHVETWLCALGGQTVSEDQDCKGQTDVGKANVRAAAHILYDWSRPHAVVGPHCVPSLQAAFPEWRKIG
jgi:hypothetical protein